jgi:hypothetical protein
MLGVVDHLAEANCSFLSCVRSEDSWVQVRHDASAVKATIDKTKYLFIYAMPHSVAVSDDQANTIKKENAFWKRSEVIRIGSKSHVCTQQSGKNPPSIYYCSDPQTHPSYTEVGLSFYLDYSNEFVRGEKVVQKSDGFRKVTAGLLNMLQDEFVTWRSPHCFDNPEVNVAIFGDHFRKKARAKGKQ